MTDCLVDASLEGGDGLRAERAERDCTFAECLPGAPAGHWWVLHTRPRQEKSVATELGRRGIGYYLPLVHLKRQYGRRRFDVRMPLFPSYVFLCGSAEDRTAALATRRIVRTLAVQDQPALVADLFRIQRLLESGEAVSRFAGVKVGRRCRVTRGPLKGLEGVVLRRRSVSRMYVGVDLLGQSGVVEIDCDYLEPVA